MDPFSIGWQQNDGKRAWRWIENQRCIDDLCSGAQNTSITLAFGLIHVNYRPGSTPRGQQIRMVSAKVQVQWQHRRTEKLYHQWNIRCRPASAEDLSNGNWFRFERGRRGRRALILEGAGSSSWFALEFVRLQHGPPVSTQINWDPLCRSKDTSLMFYSARFRNVWRIARTFNINAQRNSNWNLAFF